jgi:hypothetical protein
MLGPVRLADQFQRVVDDLPENWPDARLELRVSDAGKCERAAALLGPAAPGRSGNVIRFTTARRGAGVAPDAILRTLRRLDNEHVAGELELLACGEPVAEPHTVRRPTLAASWDAAVGALPSDWSDLYCELELRSTDHLERAALLMAPLNPARFGGTPGFRFRVARDFGYGASAEMARRCLERLDSESIRGEVRILRALSDTHPAHTQGPVWYVGGKPV